MSYFPRTGWTTAPEKSICNYRHPSLGCSSPSIHFTPPPGHSSSTSTFTSYKIKWTFIVFPLLYTDQYASRPHFLTTAQNSATSRGQCERNLATCKYILFILYKLTECMRQKNVAVFTELWFSQQVWAVISMTTVYWIFLIPTFWPFVSLIKEKIFFFIPLIHLFWIICCFLIKKKKMYLNLL